jgi:hypothetical protein
MKNYRTLAGIPKIGFAWVYMVELHKQRVELNQTHTKF